MARSGEADLMSLAMRVLPSRWDRTWELCPDHPELKIEPSSGARIVNGSLFGHNFSQDALGAAGGDQAGARGEPVEERMSGQLAPSADSRRGPRTLHLRRFFRFAAQPVTCPDSVAADQSLQLCQVVGWQIRVYRTKTPEQAKFVKAVNIGKQPLRLRRDLIAFLARIGFEDSSQRHQRRVRFELICPLPELNVDHLTQFVQAAALQQFGRQDGESVAPNLIDVTARRIPKSPNRSANCARIAASTGSGLSCLAKRSAESSARLRSSAGTCASAEKAANSLCLIVRAASASRPATGTTDWHRPVRSNSSANRAATSFAEDNASSLPAPTSSARESTPITPSGPDSPPT